MVARRKDTRLSDLAFGTAIRNYPGFFLKVEEQKDLFGGSYFIATVNKRGRVLIEVVKLSQRSAEEAARARLARYYAAQGGKR